MNKVEKLAAFLAQRVFDAGREIPELGGETRRIQFMGTSLNTGKEVGMGGFGKDSLARCLADALSEIPKATSLKGE